MVPTTTAMAEQLLTEALQRVQALDLQRITRKVQSKQGWDDTKAEQAELEYRRYLALLLTYPGRQIAPPSKDADEIWHGHILDTVAYARDCQALFGAFLHHVPSYGSADEKLVLASAREQTEALYQRHFGAETGKAQEQAFCVCMAGPNSERRAEEVAGCVPCLGRHDQQADADRTEEVAGCVPCFARQEQQADADRVVDGCVPCFGATSDAEKAATRETCSFCFGHRERNGKTVAA